MQKGKVSVIISCYNVEQFLDKAITSILQQTYTNVEVILVDDGSTDGTADICDCYAQRYEYIQVVHQGNSGQAYARNVGLSRAQGEYVYFLDSDDWIAPETLEISINKMIKNQAELLFFEAHVVDEEGIIDEQDKRYFILEEKEALMKGCAWYQMLVPKKTFSACVPYHIFRYDFLVENRLEFLPGIIHEDELYLYNIYKRAERVIGIAEPFYYRRMRTGSTMFSPNYCYMFDSFSRIITTVLEQYKEERKTKDCAQMMQIFLGRITPIMMLRYSQITERERTQRKKQLRKLLRKYLGVSMRNRAKEDVIMIVKMYYSTYRI